MELVNDDHRRRSLAEDARDYALAEFTWPAVAEKYLALYRGGHVGAKAKRETALNCGALSTELILWANPFVKD